MISLPVPGSYFLPWSIIMPSCSTIWKVLDDPPALLLPAASKAFSLSPLNNSLTALCSVVSFDSSPSAFCFWWRRLQSRILARTRAVKRYPRLRSRRCFQTLVSGCCFLWSWSPDRAPLVALLARDPPPLKPVIAAADSIVSLSPMADSPVFTTDLTVLETVVSADVVVVGHLVAVAWATAVTLDELVEVPAIVVGTVLAVAGEGASPSRGVGME